MTARSTPPATAAEALLWAWGQFLSRHPEGGPPLSVLDLQALLEAVGAEGEVLDKAWQALRLHLSAAGADCTRPGRLDFWLRNTSRASVREKLAVAGATAALLHLEALFPVRFKVTDAWGFEDLHKLLREECRARAAVGLLSLAALSEALPPDAGEPHPNRLAWWINDASHEEALALIRRAAYRPVPSPARVLLLARALHAERPPAPGASITCQDLFALLPEVGAVGWVLERAEHALTLALAEASGTDVLAHVAALKTKDHGLALAALDSAAPTAALLHLEALFPVRFPHGEAFTLPDVRRLLCEECGAEEDLAEACVAQLRALFLASLESLEGDDPMTLFQDWFSEASLEEAEDLIHRAAHRIRD